MGTSIRLSGLVWLFSVGVLFGQGDLATVTGVVMDTAQAVIPGVTVNIRNTDTGISQKQVTNQEGYFTFTELQPGSYELNA